MAAIDQLKEHYQAKLGQAPRRLEVSLGGKLKPFISWVRPSINLQKQGEISELVNSGKSADAMALTLIYRLIDKEGDPIFRKADRLTLIKHVDPDVLSEIVEQINSEDPDLEEVKKK